MSFYMGPYPNSYISCYITGKNSGMNFEHFRLTRNWDDHMM
ncbi:conserved hypothetical protein [Bacillus spizizenii str. W23]|uniref:Uncharacterized protein n=1 Tax=Bacillus spizizenii (strain ATCC 23059 / NRRL B-14472 / W23) TaxID=655816 RepID=E0U350_BACSH|nr:conserved hypothetical protein [Bacillus spizizenii str. W23]